MRTCVSRIGVLFVVVWLGACASEVSTSQTQQHGGSNSFCGDGEVGVNEECDDGNDDNTDDCIIDPGNEVLCRLNVCGDGYVHLTGTGPFEQCDTGNFSTDGDCIIDDSGGATDCKLATCGDGFLHLRHEDPPLAGAGDLEDCDAQGESAFCNLTCTVAACGDGVVNTTSGEECDDGNADNNDDCIIEKPSVPTQRFGGPQLLNCVLATCGDTFLHTSTVGTPGAGPLEQCDDGNTVGGDACPATCGATCGDGVVSGDEACDPGAAGATSTCDADCTQVTCGDGVINLAAGEQCDDGVNNSNDPGRCRPITCKKAACGDGVTDANEECDDGTDNGLTASSPCSLACTVQGFTARSGGCADAGGGGAGVLTALFLVGAVLLTRRRRGVTMVAMLVASALAVAPTAARAEGFALTRFAPPPSYDDGLTIILPTTLDEAKLSAMLTFDLADRPLVLKAPSGGEVNVVRKALGAHADFAYGVTDRFELHVDLPVTLAQSGDSGSFGNMTFDAGSTAVGDGRVGFVVDAYGDRHSDGFGVGGALDVVFPIGSQDNFSGDGNVGLDMHFLTTYTLPSAVVFALDTGLVARPRNDFVDVRFGAELLGNAGVHIPVTSTLRVLAEIDGAVPLRAQNDGLPMPLETLGGVRYQLGPWVLGAGGGVGLTDAVGTPSWRVLATVGWTSQGTGTPDRSPLTARR